MCSVGEKKSNCNQKKSYLSYRNRNGKDYLSLFLHFPIQTAHFGVPSVMYSSSGSASPCTVLGTKGTWIFHHLHRQTEMEFGDNRGYRKRLASHTARSKSRQSNLAVQQQQLFYVIIYINTIFLNALSLLIKIKNNLSYKYSNRR